MVSDGKMKVTVTSDKLNSAAGTNEFATFLATHSGIPSV